jgi:hypothetical protein
MRCGKYRKNTLLNFSRACNQLGTWEQSALLWSHSTKISGERWLHLQPEVRFAHEIRLLLDIPTERKYIAGRLRSRPTNKKSHPSSGGGRRA